MIYFMELKNCLGIEKKKSEFVKDDKLNAQEM